MRGGFAGKAFTSVAAAAAVLCASLPTRAQSLDRTDQSVDWSRYGAPVAVDSHVGAFSAMAPLDPSFGRDTAPRERWYGWQTLLTDSASLSLVGIGVATADSSTDRGRLAAIGLSAVGALGYAIGGPIVHFEHGQRSNALASLAIRAALPVGGALAGYLVGLGGCAGDGQSSVPCPVATAMIGGVSGLGAAVLVDALGLGYAPIEAARGTVVFAPTLETSRTGVRIGVSGAF